MYKQRNKLMGDYMSRFSARRNGVSDKSLKVGFFIFIFVLIGLWTFIYQTSSDYVTATVTDKENVTRPSGDTVESYYLVYTDKETLTCQDDMWRMKFNSSDVYGRIKRERTYKFYVVGFCVPFLSTYRNIITAEEVPQ